MSNQEHYPKPGDVVLEGCFGGFVTSVNKRHQVLMVQRESGNRGHYATGVDNLAYIGTNRTSQQVWELLSDSDQDVLTGVPTRLDIVAHSDHWSQIRADYVE